ncbi:MAG: hypothetical protein RL272_732 [Candidatus Parcubacteria bacterium]|jgi:ribonuclease P protein component
MLARKYRLTAEKDYARIFAKGRPFNGRGTGMKVIRNRLETPRVGFVVSTKVSKRAVERNQVKRRMREIVRKRLPGIIGGIDIVFMARPESVKMSFVEIERSMVELITKAGVFKNV